MSLFDVYGGLPTIYFYFNYHYAQNAVRNRRLGKRGKDNTYMLKLEKKLIQPFSSSGLSTILLFYIRKKL